MASIGGDTSQRCILPVSFQVFVGIVVDLWVWWTVCVSTLKGLRRVMLGKFVVQITSLGVFQQAKSNDKPFEVLREIIECVASRDGCLEAVI